MARESTGSSSRSRSCRSGPSGRGGWSGNSVDPHTIGGQLLAARRSSLSNRSVFLASVAVFVALGSVWVLATPPEASPDEPEHTMRAAAVARGDVGGRSVVTPSPGPGQVNRVEYA